LKREEGRILREVAAFLYCRHDWKGKVRRDKDRGYQVEASWRSRYRHPQDQESLSSIVVDCHVNCDPSQILLTMRNIIGASLGLRGVEVTLGFLAVVTS